MCVLSLSVRVGVCASVVCMCVVCMCTWVGLCICSDVFVMPFLLSLPLCRLCQYEILSDIYARYFCSTKSSMI